MTAATATAESSSFDWLGSPIMWRHLNACLTGDIRHDAEIVRSFAEAAGIPARRVIEQDANVLFPWQSNGKLIKLGVTMNRQARPEGGGLEQRRKLWDAVNEFVRQTGGWVTSVPGVKDMRIEVPQGSSLPAKLTELGYEVRHAGAGSRIANNAITEIIDARTVHHSGFMPVDIIEITLAN